MPGPLIGEPPEPLSRRALEILRTAGQRCRDGEATLGAVTAQILQLDAFIQNSRSDRLRTELRRYCEGEQDGVSILVSGTRGAGKTTTAKLAVQQLIAESILRPTTLAAPATRMVPLPIVLHGPTLMARFSDEDEPRIAAQERKRAEDTYTLGIAARGRENRQEDGSDQDEAARFRSWEGKAKLKRTVLRGLITALYKHIAMMLTEAWEESARQDGASTTYSSLSMLRAHLELTLDESPDEVTLRRIWRRAGKLRGGVMHHLYLPLEGDSPPLPLRPDQGLREIVALAACGKSYLGILGQTKEVVGRKLASGERTYQDIGVASQGGEGEAEKGEKGEKGKEKGGGRLFSIFKFGGGRSRDASGNRDLTVEVDWSERRLERELPHLLRRVKAAGIAPIFILDELDKLDDADRDLADFLECSKHIVRDHAAFVFLPDRDYMIRLERGRA